MCPHLPILLPEVLNFSFSSSSVKLLPIPSHLPPLLFLLSGGFSTFFSLAISELSSFFSFPFFLLPVWSHALSSTKDHRLLLPPPPPILFLVSDHPKKVRLSLSLSGGMGRRMFQCQSTVHFRYSKGLCVLVTFTFIAGLPFLPDIKGGSRCKFGNHSCTYYNDLFKCITVPVPVTSDICWRFLSGTGSHFKSMLEVAQSTSYTLRIPLVDSSVGSLLRVRCWLGTGGVFVHISVKVCLYLKLKS